MALKSLTNRLSDIGEVPYRAARPVVAIVHMPGHADSSGVVELHELSPESSLGLLSSTKSTRLLPLPTQLASTRSRDCQSPGHDTQAQVAALAPRTSEEVLTGLSEYA